MKKFSYFLIFLFTLSTVNAQNNFSFNYFDYVNDSSYIEDKHGSRLNKVLLPRLVSTNGFVDKANEAITNYSRNYTSSNLNTSGASYKYGSSSSSCENYLDVSWTELGPFGDNIKQQYGQIHNFDYSNNFATDNTMYSCDYFSGLYKSTNRGLTWSLVTQSRKLPFAGVGDVEIHEDNTNKLFVSTGSSEYHPGWFYPSVGENTLVTHGIFRSVDGGSNWKEIMDAGFWSDFEKGGNITNMYLDPYSTGKNRMYITTSKGVWKCDNVSATNPVWTNLINTTHPSSSYSNFFSNVEEDYASNNHLYFTGKIFVRHNKATGNNVFYNFPKPAGKNVLNSRIATTPADPDKVYCFIKYGILNDDKYIDKPSLEWKILVFSKSANQFTEIYNDLTINQTVEVGLGRIALDVSPSDPNLLIYGDYQLHVINTALTSNSNPDTYAAKHDDIHTLSFAPDGQGIYMGCDGGVSFLPDETGSFSKSNWQVRHQGINNSLVWEVDDSEVDSKMILVGAQDNHLFSKTNSTNWQTHNGGDGYNVAIDDNHPSLSLWQMNTVLYRFDFSTLSSVTSENSYKPGSLMASTRFANHPKTGKLYGAIGDGLFERQKKIPASGDSPSTIWTRKYTNPSSGNGNSGFVYSFEFAESNPDVIYLSNFGQANINSGPTTNWGDMFFKTSDGGLNWTNLTNKIETSYNQSNTPNINHYLVSGIAVSPTNPQHVWVSFTGYTENLKVWESTDGGQTWSNTDPNNCLKNLPVNDIVYQNGTDDRLYIATDVGVYTRDNNSSNWYRYGDIPNLRITNLKINRCSGKMKAGTYGRGVWEVNLMPDNGKITNYQSISTHETWTEDKAMTRNISVAANKILTIDGATIYMPKNGRIVVHKNAKLILKNGAKITNGCGEMWKGITVLGTTASPQPTRAEVNAGTYYNQGILIMNDATLEYAHDAIRLHLAQADLPVWPFYLQFNGGVVFAKECSFINNRRSAEFMKYNTVASSSVFEDCEFIINDDYRLEEVTPHHISMWDNHGINIVSCTFEDQRAGIEIDDDRKATGIFTIDADFTSRGKCNGIELNNPNMDCNGTIIPNKFINLKRGIHAETTGELPAAIQVYSNLFENCYRGISLRSVDNIIMVKNDFEGTTVFPRKAGVYMEATDHYTFSKNNFNNIFQASLVMNSGAHLNNKIYKNNFGKDYTSIVFSGVQASYNNDKLTIDCNNFEDQIVDVYASTADLQGNISLGNQGTLNNPVANTFKNSHFGNHNGYLSAVNTTSDNYTYYGFSNQGVDIYTPEFGTTPSIFRNEGLSFPLPSRCADIDLRFITGKNSEGGLGLSGYHSLLASLDYTDPDDAVVIDDIVHLLTQYYLNNKQLGEVTTLLSQFTDKWHQVQLASYYTLDGKYDLSKNILNTLIAQNIDIEAKELAEVYFIKNKLERLGKTWFEMTPLEKNTISNFAKRSDFSPATVKSRNILNLTDGLFFEEEIKEPDFDYSAYETETEAFEPEMKQYPNPLIGTLNLEYTGTIDQYFKVEIYNLLDNTHVYSGNMPNTIFSLDVSAWTSGFYSIVVTDHQGQQVYKSKTKIKN